MIAPTSFHELGRWIVRRYEHCPGIWRLHHWLLNTRQLRFPSGNVEVAIAGALRMRVDPNDLIGRTIFHRGLWERPVALHFHREVRQGDTVLDVGANLGQFTLLSSRAAGTSGRVFAVEANPQMALNLRHNVALNQLTNVEVIEAAAWDCDDQLRLLAGEPGNQGMASVASAGAEQAGTLVPAVRLDRVLRELGCSRIDVIKIDVEGAEERALRGLAGILDQQRPRRIYCEVNAIADDASAAESLIDLLASWGYRGAIVDENGERPLVRASLAHGFLETVVFSRP